MTAILASLVFHFQWSNMNPYSRSNIVARSMKKMLDGVPEADAGGGGVIGRILDEGCWLSIIDVIICCVGGLPENTGVGVGIEPVSAVANAIRTHGFNHPSGIDQSPGAKALVPGQQTNEVSGVIYGSLATDHWNWIKKKCFWTWNFLNGEYMEGFTQSLRVSQFHDVAPVVSCQV